MQKNPPAYPIASVDNALRLVVELREGTSLRLVDAAALLGVAGSTAHRLLSMLEYRGFAVQNPDTRAYEAGPALRDPFRSADPASEVRRAARPQMERIAETLGETVHLLFLEGTGVRFAEGVEGSHGLRVGTRIGFVLPAHATSGGKALLAALGDDEVSRLFADDLAAATPHTITDVASLLRELGRIRRRGYATNIEESEPGVAAVGACIRGLEDDPVGAMAIAAPLVRLSKKRLPEYVGVLLDAVNEVSATLRAGHVDPPVRSSESPRR